MGRTDRACGAPSRPAPGSTPQLFLSSSPLNVKRKYELVTNLESAREPSGRGSVIGRGRAVARSDSVLHYRAFIDHTVGKNTSPAKCESRHGQVSVKRRRTRAWTRESDDRARGETAPPSLSQSCLTFVAIRPTCAANKRDGSDPAPRVPSLRSRHVTEGAGAEFEPDNSEEPDGILHQASVRSHIEPHISTDRSWFHALSAVPTSDVRVDTVNRNSERGQLELCLRGCAARLFLRSNLRKRVERHVITVSVRLPFRCRHWHRREEARIALQQVALRPKHPQEERAKAHHMPTKPQRGKTFNPREQA
jgi:hypothetical protein